MQADPAMQNGPTASCCLTRGSLLGRCAVRVAAIVASLSIATLVIADGFIEPAAAAAYDRTGEETVLFSQEVEARLAGQFSAALSLRNAPDTMCLSVLLDDRLIVQSQSSLQLLPASLMKLVTATVALDVMRSDEAFKTEVFVRADALSSIVDGVLNGDIYLVGRGDPVLSTPRYVGRFPESVAHTDMTTLADRVFATLAVHGVARVSGRVVGDDSWFPDRERDYINHYPDDNLGAVWEHSYVTSNNVGPLSALLLNDGYSSYSWSTASAGRRLNVRASDPAEHAASVFDDLLEARGMVITRRPRSGIAPSSVERMSVGSIESPPLSEILIRMLGRSDNTTAEMLFKQIGRRTAGSARASTVTGVQTTLQRRLGQLAEGLVIADGSGLSRHNRLTCAAIVELLRQAGPGSPVVEGLSVASERGTLRLCYPSPSRHNEGNVIHAKTGSLNDVTALAGTAVAANGEVVTFAMMANFPGRIGLGTCNSIRMTLLNAAAGYTYGPSPSNTPVHLGDREALMALFDTTGGESWFNAWGWGTSSPLARWQGVATDSAGRVIEIDLSGPLGNGLTGMLPEKIGTLGELTRLYLSGNDLAGSLPSQMSGLTKLRELQLSRTGLCVSRQLQSWKFWLEDASATRVPICTSFVDTFGTVYAEPIEVLAKIGILEDSGCSEAYICPEDPIDRATIAVWLTRIFDDDEPTDISVSSFTDVNPELWWARHVERLAELDITAGCAVDPLRYCPALSVKRGQMAAFLTRALDAAAAAGIMGDCAAEPLRDCPAEIVTRGEAAAFLAEAYRIHTDQSQGIAGPEGATSMH